MLTKRQTKRLDEMVADGHFASCEAALEAALDLLDADVQTANALVIRLTNAYEQTLNGQLAEGNAEEVIRRTVAPARIL